MGLFRYMKLRHQREALVAEIITLKASNEELRRRVEALKTDPESIEQLAREQGLVKEGETVYQYEDK
jgi:cell division protein FtsB